MGSDALESETPPRSPCPKLEHDTEVSSQKELNQEGRTSGDGYAGAVAQLSVDGGGDLGFGPQLDTVPETFEALGSDGQPPLTRGGDPAPRATSAQPEVQGSLLTVLKSASIVDAHRALMGMVIEKVQAAESGLNESRISLIKGLEVSF